ncbi:hypothetical protein LPJ56_004189 [Coemansia sp. RSA 2599]|nr:hypothetical protein LPJ75_004009 [Coemansia sp. RSA 2598]KAJ1816896.1 hypothetical protein LPJ56_004189 [Coemansia sp. RSA 2599]
MFIGANDLVIGASGVGPDVLVSACPMVMKNGNFVNTIVPKGKTMLNPFADDVDVAVADGVACEVAESAAVVLDGSSCAKLFPIARNAASDTRERLEIFILAVLFW